MATDTWASDLLTALNKLANSASNTWEQAKNYATLPSPATCSGSTWLVLEGTGIWPANKPSGWYYSDGAVWAYLGAYNPVVTGGNVVVTNFPAAFGISGSVLVGNFPAVQPVSGTVSVNNFPSSQPVTGNFWQATQPVSGTVSVGNFPATQPVSGSVSVSNFPMSQAVTGTFWPATQPVSGAVTVSNFPVTQPVSGTFWQATQPISGSVSVSNFPASQAVTGTFWQATQPISGSVSVSNFPATQPVSGPLTDAQLRASALPVSGAFFPATQPVSAVSLPLPSGASTEATLALIKAKTDNLDVLLSSRTKPADTQVVSVSNFPATQPVSGSLATIEDRTTGRALVMKTGTLVTTATTADQVVLTYTVTAGKTFFLEYLTVVGRLTVVGATASIMGTISLETPSGTKTWTVTWTNPTISLVQPVVLTFGEPLPIAAGTVVRFVCTPAAATSMTWIGNFGGYEK